MRISVIVRDHAKPFGQGKRTASGFRAASEMETAPPIDWP